MNEKSIRLFLDKSFEAKPECTQSEFVENEHGNDEEFLKTLITMLAEVAEYIVPFFHSTKIIAATNKAEFKSEEDLEAGMVWE